MIGGFGLDAFPGAEPHAHSWNGPGQKAGAIFRSWWVDEAGRRHDRCDGRYP